MDRFASINGALATAASLARAAAPVAVGLAHDLAGGYDGAIVALAAISAVGAVGLLGARGRD